MLFLKKYKKYASSALILFLVCSGLYNVLAYKKAEAFTVNANVFADVNTPLIANSLWEDVVQTYHAIENGVHNRLIEMKEFVFDGLAWMAANVMIDRFTDSLVEWINNGFQGGPGFITNFGGFMKDVANDVSGAFIDKFNLEFLCSPLGEFGLDISFFLPGTSRSKYACTFSDIVENFQNPSFKFDVNVNITQENIVREYGRDFRSGSWLMWLAMADPKNNAGGRNMQVTNDLAIKTEEKKDEEKQLVQQGRGFLGMKVCLRYQDTGGGARRCEEWETRTPGSIVQSQLDHSTNAKLGKLQVADEIDEVVGALLNQLIGWVITGGSNKGLLGYRGGDSGIKVEDVERSRELNGKKMDLSIQAQTITKWERVYRNAMTGYWFTLDKAIPKMTEIKTKLECINANETATTSDNGVCSKLDQNDVIVKNNIASSTIKDINKISGEIVFIANEAVSASNGTTTSQKIIELIDEFDREARLSPSKGDLDSVVTKYCFFYDNVSEGGIICEKNSDGSKTDYYTHSKIVAEQSEKKSSGAETEMNKLINKYQCVLNGYIGKSDAACEG